MTEENTVETQNIEEGKRGFGVIWIFVIILGVVAVILYFNLPEGTIDRCGDGTLYGECSEIKPYFCSDGTLIENSDFCGCPEGYRILGKSCVSEYHENSKEVVLDYVLAGDKKNLNFDVYESMESYVSDIPREINYNNGQIGSRLDFKLNAINEETQRNFLLPLVAEIQNLSKDKDEQARIAVSIAQNIEYGFPDEKRFFAGTEINISRYPYEVIYENKGICGEKSQVLAFLLKEMGFGVAIFYNQEENHESVGIKCPLWESWHWSGYCFVETSGPAIISDSSLVYSGGITLDSKPEVLKISEGASLSMFLEEYDDADRIGKLRKKNGKLSSAEEKEFESLKEKYGLNGEYGLA